jgi:hypothetical protein
MKKPAVVLFLALALLAVSCPMAPAPPSTSGSLIEYSPDLESRRFDAYDNGEPNGAGNESNYYTVEAVKLKTGEYCEVWVDRTVSVSEETAARIADKFDTAIQPVITPVFGSYDAIFKEEKGKILLLLLDIKDNYGKANNMGYVVGYFDSRDIMSSLNPIAYQRGNKAAMLYIDTNPNRLDSEQTYATIAHELQHLINFVNTYNLRTHDNIMYTQNIWIDEGLATAAEYIYLEGHDTARVDHFNRDPYGTIAEGNNFFIWGEDRNKAFDTVLDEYATVYMFFQWLRIQSGGETSIYTEIAQSTYSDYHAVTEAAAKYFGGDDAAGFGDWPALLGAWHQANYRNEPAGRYGYGAEGAELKPRVWAKRGASYPLYPGEAVSSIYRGPVPEDNGDIRYIPMTRTHSAGNVLNDGGMEYRPNDTARMLMFNTSDDLFGARVQSALPGNGESKPLSASSGRNLLEGAEPYPVDVRDIWGRGREGPLVIDGPAALD